MKFSTYQTVARLWWIGEWKHEICFNSRILDSIAVNGGELTNETTQQIADKYKVARQFPKFSKVAKAKAPDEYAPVVKCVNAILPSLSTTALPDMVCKTADDLALMRIVDRGGKRRVVKSRKEGNFFTNRGCAPVSAVSKWTWFGRPDVGVIYDKEARMTLRRLGHSVPEGNYRAYVTAFEDAYAKRASDLEYALDSLGPEKPTESWASRKLLDLWLWYNSPTNNNRRSRKRC